MACNGNTCLLLINDLCPIIKTKNMSFIKVADGTNLYYKESGFGKPIVFVHGWCINCDSWEYIMEELADNGYRCIAYDQRGCGRSDQPWTGYDYGSLAVDLARLIETLGLNDIILVGHSMGCGVVTDYLANYGESKVKKAVYISTSTPYVLKGEDNPDGIDKMFLDMGLEFLKKDRPAFVRSLVDAYLGLSLKDNKVSADMTEWTVAITMQASLKAGIEMFRTTFVSDQREELKKIRIPVLMLHGDQDTNAPIPVTADLTHQLLLNSELKIIEGGTHGMYVVRAAEMNKEILEFIAG
jgi:non-heme chloroperoxidase